MMTTTNQTSIEQRVLSWPDVTCHDHQFGGVEYRLGKREIADAIQVLLNAANVETDVPAIEAGLDIHEAGGDFADGVIAYQGRALGGDIFVSFDQDAVKLMARQGFQAELAGAVRR